MDESESRKLALVYAESKFKEYLLEKREAPLCGNVGFSDDEIEYMKSAYDYAISKLTEKG